MEEIHLPDPTKYDDPIRYFRDSHKVISTEIGRLETMISEAERIGVNEYFRTRGDIAKEMVYFLTHIAPRHEMDEEKNLFPVLRDKIDPIGFQLPNTTPAFLIKEHEQLNYRARIINKAWEDFMKSGSVSVESEHLAIATAKELVSLYKTHMAEENKLIYTIANDELLSPSERIEIMKGIQEGHSPQIVTPMLQFDVPAYSTPELSSEEEAG